MQEMFGAQNTEVVSALMMRATLELAEHRGEAALATAKLIISTSEAMEGAESDYALGGYAHLMYAWRMLGDENKAAEVAKRAFTLSLKNHPADDPATVYSQGNWAESLVRLKRYEEARVVLERIMAIVAGGKDVDKSPLMGARLALVRVIVETGVSRQREPKHELAELKGWVAEAKAFFDPKPTEREYAEEAGKLAVALAGFSQP